MYVQCTSKYSKRFNGDDFVPTLNARCGNGRQFTSMLQLQCFNIAARLAVRSENQLELEKDGLLAKTLNLKHLRAAEITLVSQFCRTHVECQR